MTNRRKKRPDPNKKKRPPKRVDGSPSSVHSDERGPGLIVLGWGKATAIIGLVASMLGIYSVFPNLSVSPDTPLDPADPTSAPFIVTNNGFWTLSDMLLQCRIERKISTRTIVERGNDMGNLENVRDDLNPSESRAVSCNGAVGNGPGLYVEGAKVLVADVTIWVSYAISAIPLPRRTRSYAFHTVTDASGQFRWIAGRRAGLPKNVGVPPVPPFKPPVDTSRR